MAMGESRVNPDSRLFPRRFVDSRSRRVMVDSRRAFTPIRRIGGDRGWYFADILWRTRGLVDQIVGGVGMGRGRREPDALKVGDVIDCWRVEEYEEGALLRLVGEMKLPGRAWLQFRVTGEDGWSEIVQTASFESNGVLGAAYWYALYPLHAILFRGMLRNIAREAERA